MVKHRLGRQTKPLAGMKSLLLQIQLTLNWANQAV